MRSLSTGFLCLFSIALAADSWTPIGPFGGAAEAIALHAGNPARLYLLSKNSLLYRSDDAGGWWKAVRWPAQQAGHAHALAIDPNNADIVYAGLGSPQSAISGGYKSTDGGRTWKALKELGPEVFSLAIHPTDSRIVAAGVRTGVFLSRDAGESWQRISPENNKELQPVMSLGFDARSLDVIYAGTPHLPWKTSDGGKTWTSIHRGMHDDSDILALSVNRLKPDQVIIGACSGIYRSDNGAAQWRKLMGITGAGFRTYAVAMDPRNADIIYSGTRDGLWRSSDGGKAWKKLAPNIVKSIAISPDSRKIYLATEDAGVLLSNDGGATFRAAQNGFADLRFHSMTAAGPAVFVETPAGLSSARWTDSNASWKAQPPPPSNARLVDMISVPASGWIAATPTGIWRWSTASATASAPARRSARSAARSAAAIAPRSGLWSAIAAPPGRIAGIGTLCSAVNSCRLVAATARGLFEQSAKAWKPIALPPGAGAPLRLWTPAADTSAPMLVETPAGLFASGNQGKAWMKNAMPVPTHEVYRLAASGNILYLATARGLYRFAGGNWQISNRGIESATVNTIAVHPGDARTAFVAQFGKIYRSIDAGSSWNELKTEELAGASVAGLLFPGGERNQLLALTASRGVFVLNPENGTAPAASSSQ